MFQIRNPNHPLAHVFWPIAAVFPAALFSVIWRLLNSDFLPHIGKGANSVLVCVLAGAAFWLWSYLGLLGAIQERPAQAFLRGRARYIFWQLLASVIAIPGGRIVFSILPPWDNSVGAVLGVFIGYFSVKWFFSKSSNSRFVHNRGTVILSPEEVAQRIKALPAGTEPRIKWAGFDLPGEIAEGNLLVAGAIGMGKTRIHRETMASILSSLRPGADRRVLIYDVKSDLLSELSTMEVSSKVLVMNPFDKRSVAWDVAADVKTPDQARHFAESLILPAKEGDAVFFTNAARAIVAGVINALNRTHPGNWNLRRLIRLTATRARLERVLAGSDLIDQFFSPPDTFSNIQNTIATVMVELEPVAALWERTESKISLKEWVKTGDSILILGGKEDLQSSLQPINRVALKMIATAFLSEGESPRKSRLWFFCDELKSAGRLDSLPALLNARSKGVRCVLGFQDMEGLVLAYGNHETAKEILHRCATVSWLKLTSTDTADWASKRSGEVERFEYMESKNSDKGSNSVSENLTKRDAVLASEFLNLRDFVSGNVHGIHLFKGLGGVFGSIAHYEFPKTAVLDFDPRPEGEQELTTWNEDDDEWLDNGASGGGTKPPVKPNPVDPDLGSLGRITF